MKKIIQKNRVKFLIACLILLNTFTGYAQYTESREFVRRFKIQSGTRIDLTNKYGRIELNTWDKDSVVIRVKMELNEKKPIKPDKSLNKLDFDISNSQHYLIVKTQVDQNRTQVENELVKFKETILQNSGSIRIDLTVWLPDNRELRLENKFGDIIMGDYHGETQILLSNGKLKIGELTKLSSLNIGFADANIGSLTNARIVSNYSDITVKNAENLRIESKSSEIEIQHASNLNIDSRRDKFRLRLVENIDASGNFSNFMIAELKEKANLRLSYGSVDVDKIVSDFSNIYIDARSADMNLYFQPETRYSFVITETKTDLNLGKEVKTEEKEILDAKEGKIRHTGYFLKKTDEDQLIINAIGGEINILSY
jgi:hypothetical protein